MSVPQGVSLQYAPLALAQHVLDGLERRIRRTRRHPPLVVALEASQAACTRQVGSGEVRGCKWEVASRR